MPIRETLILLFALTWPAFMTWVFFVVLAGEGRQANPLLLGGALVGKGIQFAFPLLVVYFLDGRPLRLPPLTTRGLLENLVFGVLTGAVILAAYYFWLRGNPILGRTPELIWGKLTELGATTPLRFWLLVSAISVVHSLLEEYYWRWFVFGRLHEDFRTGLTASWALGLAILVSSLGFMAHHVVVLGGYFPDQFWTLAMRFSLAVALGGAVWAYLYYSSGSLYAVWLSHLLIDYAIMWVGFEIVRSRLA